MSIRVAIEHRTGYRYDGAVELGPHVVRLRPAPHCRTPILSYSLQVTPKTHFLNWQQDPFGNYLARLVFPERTDEMSVTVDLVADMTVINPFDFFVDDSAQQWPFTYEESLARDLAPYLAVPEPGPTQREWLTSIQPQPSAIIDFLVALNQRVFADVSYSVRMETGVLSPEQTLVAGIGSCRDSAWLLVDTLRRLGLAARFASGYLIQLAPDPYAQPLGGPAGPTRDFTDLHAWAEAYIPGAGWIGLDATSGLLAGEGHIPLACTSHPASAAPITGTAASPATLTYTNEVSRLGGPPRVTLPYREREWTRIDALGDAVDAALEQADVRLTMGGEPTFVAVEGTEEPEWSIDALGPTKHALGRRLAERLTERFAPGALIQHGQGKWYPGEELPRWQIGIHWRTDGQPLWRDRRLLEDPAQPGRRTRVDLERVVGALVGALGLPDDVPVAAYEDPLHRIEAEAQLPAGEPPSEDVDAIDSISLSDAAERAAVIDELNQESGEPVGFAIPLYRGLGDADWTTGHWQLRRGDLYLVPGDSPMGLRLPLRSLAWVPPRPDPERSLFAPAEPLPSPEPPKPTPAAATTTARPRYSGRVAAALDDDDYELAPTPDDDAAAAAYDAEARAETEDEIETAASDETEVEEEEEKPTPITALCVQLRDGHVFIFLPPLLEGAHAVELVTAVEDAAASSGVAVIVEGYPPPADPALAHFDVTPDPGVIEVNIHPSRSWRELVQRTTSLYEAAKEVRLTSEKFALDGTHTGTGGGSHLTLGGPTPPDSALLRRPDLLRSLVTFWQHHPSLSYLFSGRFVGPTSQAPRVDEARHESLYELEIAFAELERLAEIGPPPPWAVDRLFRNLLVDITGNTHRAEFCIDKLFDPLSERQRQGVLELRGFEMPPHPRMALVQALLVRTLIARFWAEPYAAPLVRWGTELHDRFLLPWWIEADVAEVTEDLKRHGFDFDAQWLQPFLEFRFPRLGTVMVDGVSLELRGAIEPWNVLGEEQGAATSRYVDSSLERLQVRVDGLNPGRHAVTCNGIPLPLHATETPGTFVAGVRYRAWQPPSALHPTIPVHAPLHFDVVDRASERSLGGCTYHVVHPGGRSYDVAPANANEAEARRSSRFEALGHTPGAIRVGAVADARPSGEYPRTLDLRRASRR